MSWSSERGGRGPPRVCTDITGWGMGDGSCTRRIGSAGLSKELKGGVFSRQRSFHKFLDGVGRGPDMPTWSLLRAAPLYAQAVRPAGLRGSGGAAAVVRSRGSGSRPWNSACRAASRWPGVLTSEGHHWPGSSSGLAAPAPLSAPESAAMLRALQAVGRPLVHCRRVGGGV